MHAASRNPNRMSAAYPAEVRKLSIGFPLYLMTGSARCTFMRASCLEWGSGISPRESFTMPIATAEVYVQMLDEAKQHGFAYPSINVTSSQTLNAALRGFADAGSDGIVQVSTGGAEYLSGSAVKDMVTGSVALADFAHVVAAKYPVHIALHTDHCPKDKLDAYVRPLVAISKERVARGEEPLFQSHMWDGSAVPLKEHLEIAAALPA